MMTQRSKVRRVARIRLPFWLVAAGCIGLVLGVSFVHGRVSADASVRPASIAAPSAQSVGPWDVQQQAIVHVEVDVRDEDDVALLRSMGYTCGVGACTLELPDGAELALIELGLPARVVERAIKISGAALAASAEAYESGANYTNVAIPNGTGPDACGAIVHSDIVISGAPAGVTVSRITYSLRILHVYVHDVSVSFGPANTVAFVPLRPQSGGTTDDGSDDDPENDYDIEIYGRPVPASFDGVPVNRTWWLRAEDCSSSHGIGYIDSWSINVFYDCTGLTPGTPAGPSPADGATNRALSVDLNWADAANAIAYDVYWGTVHPSIAPLTLLGSTNSSNYALPTLACGTHYYWKIVARNQCGSASGPVWDFTTVGAPGAPAGPAPADGATDQPLEGGVSWTAAANATSYDVYLGTIPPFIIPLPLYGTTTGNSFPTRGLTCGTRYYWKVVAKNDCGETSGPVWDFYTTCCMPGMPADPSPGDGAAGRSLDVDLDWADDADATSYDVYMGMLPPFIVPLPLRGTTTSSNFALGPLACGTRYFWKIVAKNDCGETTGPVWDFYTVCCLPGAPAGPSPGNGAINRSIHADLDWADAAGVESYDVYFGTSASPPWLANTASSSYALPALAQNTRYYWKIVAKSSCGETAGPVWNFTTQGGAVARTIHLPIFLRR